MLTSCGPYTLQRPLGEGGAGTVFLAVDRRTGQAVALKVVDLPETADDSGQAHEMQARFAAESLATQRLSHPDIAVVIDAGRTDKQGWIAMELVPGVSLQRYARRPRLLPEPVVLRIGHRLAAALAHVHAAGLVHRDLKPSNVMVHWPSDVLKLTDFGVARGTDAQATRTGLVLGSPDYLAPEQLAGAAPSPATDLYALGVTLFELLAGRRPFVADSLGALLQQVARQPAPDLRSLVPAVPAVAAELVLALLAKQAAHRPADAAEVAARLAPWAAPP